MDTWILAIGVSKYLDRKFSCLPGADLDAQRFIRSFNRWGVKKERTILLCNENATKKNILSSLNFILENITPHTKIIIYFAGHGLSLKEKNNEMGKPYFVTYDTIHKTTLVHGLSLSQLLSKYFKTAGSTNYIYIFSDACNINLSPHFLCQFKSKPPYFIVCAAQNSITFEDDIDKAGLFTRLLLQQIASTRIKDYNSCIAFIKNLQTEALHRDLPLPDFLCSSSDFPWFLDNVLHSDILKDKEQKVVRRANLIAQLEDKLLLHAGKIIYIYGESGTGKTTLLKQFLFYDTLAIYYSLYHTERNSIGRILERLAEKIAKNLPEIFNDGLPLPGSADKTIHLLSTLNPQATIILDHLDHLDEATVIDLFTFLKSLNCQIIIASRIIPFTQLEERFGEHFSIFECHGFNFSETTLACQEWLESDLDYIHLLYTTTGGNPLHLNLTLSQGTLSSHSIKEIAFGPVKKTLKIMIACGGFLHKDLFLKTFNIPEKHLTHLEKLGLIVKINDSWCAHDLIYDLLSNSITKKELQKAFEYWSIEVNNIFNLTACRNLLVLYMVSKNIIITCPISLKNAIKNLQGRENTAYLTDLAQCLLKRQVKDSFVIDLSYALIDIGQFHYAQKLLKLIIKNPKELKDYYDAITVNAECLWWEGNFKKSLEAAQIGLNQSESAFAQYNAYLQSGMAYFFLGEWDNASSNFNLVINNPLMKKINPRFLGWALLTEGTNLALRGIKMDAGIKYIKSSIKLFKKTSNALSLASLYGNLGEILWKMGRFKTAEKTLLIGIKYAVLADNILVEIEIKRNLLHVYLKEYRRREAEINSLITDIHNLLETSKKQKKNFGRMQILNSLTTAYAYQGNIIEMEKCLKEVCFLTKNNKEYQIYTFANKSLLYILKNHKTKASYFLNKATDLAKKGDNLLAIKQIHADYTRVFKSFQKKKHAK